MTRKCYFRHRLALFLLPVFVMLGMISCTKPIVSFGNNFGSDNATNVISVDTFGIRLSTVFLDSFPTSGTGSMLIGRYHDPYTGTVTSRSYSEIIYPSALPTISTLAQFDSLELIFRINKTFYGDTTKLQRYLVSQLTSVLNYPGTQLQFFNIDTIPYDPSILGSVDVQINPTAGFTSQKTGDSVKIRLPDAQGKLLFDLLFNQSDTVKSATTFRGFFKGLTIYPDTTMPGAIFGFRDSLFVRLHYHEPGVVYQPLIVDFPYVNKPYQFNRITADRTGTPIQNISELNPEISSALTGNASYLQPSTSLYVKLLFPTLGNLLQYPDYLSVLRATLTIKPVDGTYSPIYALPPQINLINTTQANTFGTSAAAGTGSLFVDYLYGANTAYTYDVTPYIQQAILKGTQDNAINGIMLTIPAPAYNTTFNRVVVGDQFTPLKVNRISLNVFYASYY